MQLTKEQRRELFDILLGAFRNSGDLVEMVKLELGKNLAEITGNGNIRSQIFDLLEWAEAHDKIGAVITAAQATNPDHVALREFTRARGLPVVAESAGAPSPSATPQAGAPAATTHGGIHFYGPATINGPAIDGNVGNLTYNAAPPAVGSLSTAASPSGTLTTLKRNRLQADLDLLLQQHEALAQQQRLELDSAQKVVLGQKIEALESRIAALEAQLG